ncbi:hypothetical protein BDBG_16157 [Blastomyces gilchristii SLH14081]|uniref:Uncharacterized protein n=1 Tax=Blastomyces gilchristii (strain SLH14081) TaxID=559298 RepID=A0A179U9J1_BLAGS|nr:uncharacterized protein BDBG_16157 [Blastomyces gilchristii SLH14081]OAT03969.1 hypothetical protein BDBG_16157 [Blastomyces gilchristii SLH14081]
MASFGKCDKSRHRIGNETIKKSGPGPRHGHTVSLPVTASDLQVSSQPHAFSRPVPGSKQCSLSLCLLPVSSAAL